MAEIYGLGSGPGVVENLIAQWSARDADAALAWIAHQPPGDERDALTKRVAFALSSSQPVEAARLIEESMWSGPLQAEAAASLVQQWSQQDAAAARVEVWKRATSLGGVESLIEHRASVEGPGSPCPPDLLRLSVGLEDPEDLHGDLDQALRNG